MGDQLSPSTGALAGVRVLDLSRILAGPWATQLLADLGAEVIKIERPGSGDDTRAWGPPFAVNSDGSPGDAAYFFCANRGKKSVVLDISTPQGADLVRRMAMDADVLVENFKTGGLEKYGLDYPSLHAANPRLVYCSITGFGQTGPAAGLAGYDYMIQAMSGLMSITGSPDGEPMKAGVAVADLFTGLYASSAILAALRHAEHSGEGQHIDMALFDVQLATLANQASNFFVSGQAPERLGNAHPNLAPYQPFPCLDGYLVIAVGNDRQFHALCRALETSLDEDPRFEGNAKRVAHRTVLEKALSALTANVSISDLTAKLADVGVPCGRVNSIEEAFAEPQAHARGATLHQTRDDLSELVRTVSCPVRLSETPIRYNRPPPRLGQHTEEILGRYLETEHAAFSGRSEPP